MSLLFDPQAATEQADHVGVEGKKFGERYRGRYHLPLLPGEAGTKSGGDWVPYGVMSATNLAGAIVDSRALSIWERERSQIGLALRSDLVERLTFAVNTARAGGVDFAQLKETEAGRILIKQLEAIHDDAKTAAGANQASVMGTNRHDVWEMRAQTGLLLGTPAVNAEIEALERLLDQNDLERVPGLQERVVRNTELNAAGRYDDILMSRRTGRLYMGDLKTKRKTFYSWLEAWIQQAVYAGADWMLDESGQYVPGPRHHVSQEQSVLLRMPSDGSAPYLQRVDLKIARAWALAARSVVDIRSEARAQRTFELTTWREE